MYKLPLNCTSAQYSNSIMHTDHKGAGILWILSDGRGGSYEKQTQI